MKHLSWEKYLYRRISRWPRILKYRQTNKSHLEVNQAKPKSITSEHIMDWLPPHHSQKKKKSLFVFSGSQIASSTGGGSGEASIRDFFLSLKNTFLDRPLPQWMPRVIGNVKPEIFHIYIYMYVTVTEFMN